MAVWNFICRVWRRLVRIAKAVGRGFRLLGELVVYMARRVTGRLGSDRGQKHVRAVKSRSASLLSAGLVVLLLGAIGFSVYQVARHMTVGLNTLRTQEITDESYVELELYLFRDEAPLFCEGSDVCRYTVRNGEKVSVGTTLGTAYAMGNAPSDLSPAALQARLNAYSDRIALLSGMGGLGTPADARAEAEAVDRDYLGLLAAAGRGDLAAVEGFADGMLTGIGRYDILTGNHAGAGTVDSLRAEQEALLAGLTEVATLTADRSAHFFYEMDGYESVFPYASAMTMTSAEFRTMTEQPSAGIPAGAVGKLIYSPTWYAAAYVPLSYTAAVELFQQGINAGADYRMNCGNGTTVIMTLERLQPDEAGVLLVFSSQAMPASVTTSRTLKAETVAHSVSGYRIPKEAVVELKSNKTGERVNGVYILSGGVVEFRKLRILVERDGYIIVDTYENIKAMEEANPPDPGAPTDGWEYLRLNDNIITSGNELYEGKIIH